MPIFYGKPQNITQNHDTPHSFASICRELEQLPGIFIGLHVSLPTLLLSSDEVKSKTVVTQDAFLYVYDISFQVGDLVLFLACGFIILRIRSLMIWYGGRLVGVGDGDKPKVTPFKEGYRLNFIVPVSMPTVKEEQL